MGAEATVLAGTGVQLVVGGINPGNRWGDYSAMTIDPIDQCTFWYTNEYIPTNGGFNWATRIASYTFGASARLPPHGAQSAAQSHLARPVRRFPESMLP